MKEHKKRIPELDNKTKILAGVLGTGILGLSGLALFLKNRNSLLTEKDLKDKNIQQLKNINENILTFYNKCNSDVTKEEKRQREIHKINIFDKKLNDNYKLSAVLGKKLNDVLQKHFKKKTESRGGSSFFELQNEKERLISEIIYNQKELKECYNYLRDTEKRIKTQQKDYLNKIKNTEKHHINRLINIKRFSDN